MEVNGKKRTSFLGILNLVFTVADYAILIIVAVGIIYLAAQLLFDAFYDAVFLWTRHTIPHLLSELMFTLIIMELFRQVHRQINKHRFSLNPFLYIGFIASVRGLLLTQMAVTMGDTEWFQGMIQIAIHAGILLVLVVCYILYNKTYTKSGDEI
ncbi:MAG: phosphate-starvation-inducible PsiE family protein [Thermodesulfobacteriota bacterium]